MRARTVAVVSALVGGLGWLAKMVILTAQGGADPDSVPESIAFFLGMLGVLVALAATGAHLTRGRSPGLRALASLGTVLAGGLAVSAVQLALAALPGDAWVQEEAVFGIAGLVAVVVATRTLRRAGGPTGT
jgi:hypothetical protein